MGVAAFVLLRDGEATIPQAKREPIPPFEFTVEKVGVGNVAGRSRIGEEEREEMAAGIVETMNALYDGGFVAKDAWQDGTFPAALETFAPGAVDAARRDLEELTLGKESARITEVRPAENRLDLSIALRRREPIGAVARATFGADASVRGGGTVRLSHGGVYYLRPVDGAWKIVGYDVEGSIDTVGPAPGPTPTEAAS